MNRFEEFGYKSDVPPQHVFEAGGTGASTPAPDLVRYFGEDSIAFITPMADAGGRTGALRELITAGENNVPMPAWTDWRRVASAVSRNELGKVFERRLGPDATVDSVVYESTGLLDHIDESKNVDSSGTDRVRDILTGAGDIADIVLQNHGSLEGHTLGNLVLSSLFTAHKGDVGQTLAEASRWMKTSALVLPASTVPHHLKMDYEGEIYDNEGDIDALTIDDPENARIWLEAVTPGKAVVLYDLARIAIENAHRNVILPSSLFTSTGAVLMVPGIRNALAWNKHRGGTLVDVVNPEQGRDARGLSIPQFVRRVGSMAGRDVDVVIAYDGSEALPQERVPLTLKDGPDTKAILKKLLRAKIIDIGGSEEDREFDELRNLRSDGIKTNGNNVASALDSIAV